MDPLTIGILGGGIFAGMAGASVAALKGWQGWLELRRFELTHDAGERTLPPAGNRIEIADLERRQEGLHLLLTALHRADEHEIEDGEDGAIHENHLRDGAASGLDCQQ